MRCARVLTSSRLVSYAIEFDAPGKRSNRSRNQAQQRGLAAGIRAQDGDQFALVGLKAGRSQGERRRGLRARRVGVAGLLDVEALGRDAPGRFARVRQRVRRSVGCARPRSRFLGCSPHPPAKQINKYWRSGHRRHRADRQFRRRDNGSRQRIGQNNRDRAAKRRSRNQQAIIRAKQQSHRVRHQQVRHNQSLRSRKRPAPSAAMRKRTRPVSRASRPRPDESLRARR